MSLIFLLKKRCTTPYSIHIYVIKAKIKTQKSQRELELFTVQSLFLSSCLNALINK